MKGRLQTVEKECQQRWAGLLRTWVGGAQSTVRESGMRPDSSHSKRKRGVFLLLDMGSFRAWLLVGGGGVRSGVYRQACWHPLAVLCTYFRLMTVAGWMILAGPWESKGTTLYVGSCRWFLSLSEFPGFIHAILHLLLLMAELYPSIWTYHILFGSSADRHCGLVLLLVIMNTDST